MRYRTAVPAFFLLVLVLTAARGAVGATSSPAIFEIRGDGSARRLVGGVGALGFALSKGGMRLAFFRGSSEQRSIWVVNRDGSGERQLVADTRAEPILIEFPLAWSPRGDALAYTTASCPEPCTATRVVIVDAQDGHRLGEIDRAESLRWSADGRRMVWACDTEPDPYGEVETVCFTPRKGGAVQRVSARRNFVNRPLPSPDGERVAFTGLGGGPLSVLDLRRRSVRVIADPASSIDGGLTWSPDGRRLAFATAANELFTIATAGGRPRRVGRFRDARSPAWGPGGRRIAFIRGRLWTVRPDGTDARRVTREALSRNCPIDSFRRLRAGRPGRPPVGSCTTSPAAKEPCAAAGNPRLLSEAGNGHVPVRSPGSRSTMMAKCGRDGLSELLQREGAAQRCATVQLGEPRATPNIGVQDLSDRLELFHHIRIAFFEKADVADDQVDPYTARQPEGLYRTIADENAIARLAQGLVDQLLRCSVFLQDDDRRGRSSHCETTLPWQVAEG